MSRITKKKFEAYEGVRSSGLTNMFNVDAVVTLSGGRLTKEDCLEIMDNYEAYDEQYPKIKKGGE